MNALPPEKTFDTPRETRRLGEAPSEASGVRLGLTDTGGQPLLDINPIAYDSFGEAVGPVEMELPSDPSADAVIEFDLVLKDIP